MKPEYRIAYNPVRGGYDLIYPDGTVMCAGDAEDVARLLIWQLSKDKAKEKKHEQKIKRD